MPVIRLHEILPFTPQQMYDLVVDVDRYPEFLPWCVKTRTFDFRPNQFTAELTISFRGMRESFQTVDRIIPNQEVKVSLLKGPFSHLENTWKFQPAPGGTRVEFYIDFRFQNRIIDLTMGPLFSHAARQMVAAFRNRAHAIYANPTNPPPAKDPTP